jgi:simple sugar transport system substrate-binding protein
MTKSASRTLLTLLSGAALVGLLAALPGCSGGDTSGGKGGDNLTVGFIYVGPKDDYGYSQAHAQGAAAVRQALPDVKILEVEKVPEDANVQETMKNMVENDGARVIFASSFNYYDPHVLKVARQYPEVKFMHCGGAWEKGKYPDNVYTYFGYIDECQYLSGIVAGHMTRSNKLGFVAAKPIPQVYRNINAFLLGARTVNKDAAVHVVFTGDWSEPTKEADATKLLLDKGCDVFTCHVDGPRVVIEAAEKAGKYTCGYHASQAALAPNGYLTGAEWNWEKVYTDYVSKVKKGETFPNYIRGGLKDGIVKPSPYGKAVTEKAKADAEAAKAKLMTGDFVIFKGPLKSNKGAEVIAGGVEVKQTDPVLEQMDYLVEGVEGSQGKR